MTIWKIWQRSLNTTLSADIAKGLIQSGYDNDADGIIDHAPDYEDHYFDTREDDDVYVFIPCFLLLAFVIYRCYFKVDIKTGAVIYENERFNNFSDFYGYLDEDETYAIGVVDYKNV